MSTPDRPDRLATLHRSLGIPDNYGAGLPCFDDDVELIDIGIDMFDRPQRLHPAAADSWQRMQAAARRDDIELQLVSAYRSIDYQVQVLRRKLDKGDDITAVLKSVAAPGYSEHHSGRAIDISTPGCEPLTEAFEQTAAFRWLSRQAGHHGFVLSYPRDNRYGFVYEPWHWAYHDRSVSG